MSKREFDIILWGATGFTGRLCFEYLVKKYPYGNPIKWAIAGRSSSKLLELKSSISKSSNVNLDNIEVLVGDINDIPSIIQIASRTKVIMSTAGPFAKIGTPIVEACVKASTNYVDITGESTWIREIIDKYHSTAEKNKIKIIPCCGFDCIPVDVGTRFLVDSMLQKEIKPVEVRMILTNSKGDASGGTIASILNMFESSTIKTLLASLNPFFLCPRLPSTNEIDQPSSIIVSKCSDKMIFDYDSIFSFWCMPFVMQAIDTRVVHRSNALSKFKYGRNFIYSERMKAPFIVGLISTLVTPLVTTLLFFSVTRNILKLFLPSPGEGPSEVVRETGRFHFQMWGKGTNNNGENVIVKARIDAPDGDPGYKQTAVMITEAAVSLAILSSQPQQSNDEIYGILTPSTGLGNTLLKRLEDANIKFKVDSI